MIPIPRHSDLIALGWPQGNDIYTDMISVIPVCNQQREREDKKQVHDSQFFFVFLEEQWDWEDQLDDHIVLRIPFETRIPNFLVRNLELDHFLSQYSAIQEQENLPQGLACLAYGVQGQGSAVRVLVIQYSYLKCVVMGSKLDGGSKEAREQLINQM